MSDMPVPQVQGGHQAAEGPETTSGDALLAVFTTVATLEDAERMARALVERRLAACVQIQAIQSVYRWQGQVQLDCEQGLMCKTSAERYPALEAAIRELHGYELPAIHALRVDQAWAPYAAWVRASVQPEDDTQGQEQNHAVGKSGPDRPQGH
jgi:periplasmic divalent cation tolerance protein